ncbi:MAG: polysaccharide biosynthesis tyrosine autokinase [Acidobacteriota bacterium]
MSIHESERLPAVMTQYAAPLYGPPLFQGQDEDPEEARVPLSQYLWILKRYRWRIIAFALTAVILTTVVSARLTPIFEATATIDVDRATPSDVVGQDSARAAFSDAEQFMATQMKLVESDSVLRPVDQRFELRKLEKQSSADGSARGEAAPVKLKQLKVTRPPSTYLMLVSYRSEDPQLAADAANAIAQSYLEHTYNIRVRSSANLATFMERQLQELRDKMELSGKRLVGFERDLNVVNPEEKTNILAARLLQLNAEYTTSQTERLRKQAAYESVREGKVDAVLAAGSGDALRKIAEHVNDAKEQVAQAKSFYGANHPEFKRAQATLDQAQSSFVATQAGIVNRVEIEFQEARRREQMGQEAVGAAKTEFDAMNARSFEYQSLKREADADKTLYDELVRKIKEAGINAGFQNSAIRIADMARPPLKPVFPNIPLNALLAFLFSTLIGIGGAVLADALDKTIRDPEQVQRTLRTEVIGSLPLLKGPNGNLRIGAPGSRSEQDTTGFGESVRTLRNSILLANFDRRIRSLLVTSASPGEGKTTTAANLAAAHAEQGLRTLLIDGDLRRPSVHRQFQISTAVGLSNVLLGEIPWREALQHAPDIADLDILPAGPPSRRASDLIGRGMVELLETAAAEYDLVVLDAPPLLGFAEPLQMATAVDGVIVVARAGQTTRKSVATVLAILSRLRAKVVGLVLNQVHKELSDSYYYYGYYRSYYRPLDPDKNGPDKPKHQEAGA